MVIKHAQGLMLILSLTACQPAPSHHGRSAPVAEGDWTLPYGKWEFAFFTPQGTPRDRDTRTHCQYRRLPQHV